jgi:hypothetical protein
VKGCIIINSNIPRQQYSDSCLVAYVSDNKMITSYLWNEGRFGRFKRFLADKVAVKHVFVQVSSIFPSLIIIPPLLYTRLPLHAEVCCTLDQATYADNTKWSLSSIYESKPGWLQSTKVNFKSNKRKCIWRNSPTCGFMITTARLKKLFNDTLAI